MGAASDKTDQRTAMAKLRELSEQAGRADYAQIAEQVAEHMAAHSGNPKDPASAAHAPHRMTGVPRRPATAGRRPQAAGPKAGGPKAGGPKAGGPKALRP